MSVPSSSVRTPRDWRWSWWPIVPLYPYGQRRTLRREIVPGQVWTFEQIQGIFYVVVPIRMTVVRLAAGGLLVYAPVALTPECLALMRELVAEYGAVKYIILPTVSGIEHKVFIPPFARQFPSAQVWVAPQQWSFPLNLPLTWLGFPRDRTYVIPPDGQGVPFGDEFDIAVLGPIGLGLGSFAEVALHHRRSRTLLLTDAIVSVPAEPPPVVQLDPYPLLFHAKDTAADAPPDTPEQRRKGWQRIALFSFFFRPSALDVIPLGQAIQLASQAGDRSRQAYWGVYPFRWQGDWEASFAALCGEGRPFVAPILQTLILNRDPDATITWANRVASWEFARIVPCHLDAPIAADARQFRHAFRFLDAVIESASTDPYPLPPEDFALLRSLDETLSKSGITPPAPR